MLQRLQLAGKGNARLAAIARQAHQLPAIAPVPRTQPVPGRERRERIAPGERTVRRASRLDQPRLLGADQPDRIMRRSDQPHARRSHPALHVTLAIVVHQAVVEQRPQPVAARRDRARRRRQGNDLVVADRQRGHLAIALHHPRRQPRRRCRHLQVRPDRPRARSRQLDRTARRRPDIDHRRPRQPIPRDHGGRHHGQGIRRLRGHGSDFPIRVRGGRCIRPTTADPQRRDCGDMHEASYHGGLPTYTVPARSVTRMRCTASTLFGWFHRLIA